MAQGWAGKKWMGVLHVLRQARDKGWLGAAEVPCRSSPAGPAQPCVCPGPRGIPGCRTFSANTGGPQANHNDRSSTVYDLGRATSSLSIRFTVCRTGLRVPPRTVRGLNVTDENESNATELGMLQGHCWPVGTKSGWAATYLSNLSFPTSLSDVAPTSMETFVLCKKAIQRVKSPPRGGGVRSWRGLRDGGSASQRLGRGAHTEPKEGGSSFA